MMIAFNGNLGVDKAPVTICKFSNIYVAVLITLKRFCF